MEQRPIAERLQDVRALTMQYGEADAIPETELMELDYVRLVDVDGTTSLKPLEKVMADAINKNSPEAMRQRRAPFDTLSFDVDVKGGAYACQLSGKQMLKSMELGMDSLHTNPKKPNKIAWVAAGEPLQAFMEKLKVAKEPVFFDKNRGHVAYEDRGTVAEMLEDIENQVSRALVESLIPEEQRQTHERPTLGFAWNQLRQTMTSECLNGRRVSSEDAEKMWNFLDRMKAGMADTSRLEAEFEEMLTMTLEHTGTEGRGLTVYPDDPSDYEHKSVRIHYASFDEKGWDDPSAFFKAYMEEVAAVFEGTGYEFVGSALLQTGSLKEAREVMADVLAHNPAQADFKAREKALRARGPIDGSEEAIKAFRAELSQLKTEQKEGMRLLRGAHDFFNLPQMYAKAVTKFADEMLSRVTIDAETATREIKLVAPYNSDLDADPGRLSGDCTSGRPLPFGTSIPVSNVKAFMEGKHFGNMYLLKTTSDDKEAAPVWHLDAIQLPSYEIDWKTFPAALIDVLSAEAERQGVKYITVNKVAHLISNYDYIGRAFLDYMGAEDTSKVAYDQMDLPDGQEVEVDGAIKKLSVKFPANIPSDRSNFQGVNSSQLAIWQNPNV